MEPLVLGFGASGMNGLAVGAGIRGFEGLQIPASLLFLAFTP